MSSFIPTRASLNKSNCAEQLQVVTFESYKPKAKVGKIAEQDQTPKKPEAIFNMRQARNQIIKFGISGFDPEKREQAIIEQAIKLGAKPPKKKPKNYKLLLSEKNANKKTEQSEKEFQQLGKNSIGKSNAKGKSFDRKRRKGKDNSILDIYGTVKAVKKHK